MFRHFFPVEGRYRLRLRLDNGVVRLAMRYLIADRPALTATMRGTRIKLATRSLFHSLFAARQFPFRPIISIHFEALKIMAKKGTVLPTTCSADPLVARKRFLMRQIK